MNVMRVHERRVLVGNQLKSAAICAQITLIACRRSRAQAAKRWLGMAGALAPMRERAMTQLQQTSVHNRLLSGLTPEDFGLLQPHLEPVPLDLRQWLIEAGEPIQHVTFPEHCIISILADTSEGRIEVGLIGPEGMAGLPVVLGIDRSPHGYMVQAAGEALRITAQDLRTALRHSPSLQVGFLRDAHALMVQTAETAYANAGFTIEARLARWILMTDDRLAREELPLTHDFLSMMLGVRRPGVTIAVQTLEGGGLIRAKRRGITVLDRTGLEGVAGNAYGVSEAEYASAMGQAQWVASLLHVRAPRDRLLANEGGDELAVTPARSPRASPPRALAHSRRDSDRNCPLTR